MHPPFNSTFLIFVAHFLNAVNNPVPSTLISSVSIKEAKTWKSFRQGKKDAPKTLYVLGDADCIICHEFYESLKPYVDSGEVSIHWAFLQLLPNSKGRDLAIIDGDTPPNSGYPQTPQGALAYNEAFYDTALEQGGIPPTNNPSHKAIKNLNKNEFFFQLYAPFGTPFFVYESVRGGTYMSLGFDPTETAALVNDILPQVHSHSHSHSSH